MPVNRTSSPDTALAQLQLDRQDAVEARDEMLRIAEGPNGLYSRAGLTATRYFELAIWRIDSRIKHLSLQPQK